VHRTDPTLIYTILCVGRNICLQHDIRLWLCVERWSISSFKVCDCLVSFRKNAGPKIVQEGFPPLQSTGSSKGIIVDQDPIGILFLIIFHTGRSLISTSTLNLRRIVAHRTDRSVVVDVVLVGSEMTVESKRTALDAFFETRVYFPIKVLTLSYNSKIPSEGFLPMPASTVYRVRVFFIRTL
jgi:hypothetical protein